MWQRTPPDPGHLAEVGPWWPERFAATTPALVRPAPGRPPDWYVVVDELDELGCRLAVDRWPGTDVDGRLVFDDGEELVSVPPAALHAAVTAARTRQGDDAPDRALRIGDAFAWWWGPLARDLLGLRRPDRPLPEDPSEPDGTDLEVVDVTRDARRATNAAAQATAGGVLSATELARIGLGPDDVRDAGGDPGDAGGDTP